LSVSNKVDARREKRETGYVTATKKAGQWEEWNHSTVRDRGAVNATAQIKWCATDRRPGYNKVAADRVDRDV
jgi:hypothetical protein